MKLRHGAKISVATALIIALTACGGGDDRPSQDEIADAITSGDTPIGDTASDLPDSAVDCIAGALADSDLSDDALRAFVDNEADYEGSSEDDEALTDLNAAMSDCASDVAE